MISYFKDVLEIKNGRNQRAIENPNGIYPIYGSGGIMGYADQYICDANTVIIGRKGNINKPIFSETPLWNVDTAFGLVPKTNLLMPKYLFYFCMNFDFKKLNSTVTIPSLTKENLLRVKINLPTLEEQRTIVLALDKVNQLIFLHNKQLDKMNTLVKSRFVEMFGDLKINKCGWVIKPFEEVFDIASSRRILKHEWKDKGYPFYRVRDLVVLSENGSAENEYFVSEDFYDSLADSDGLPQHGDIMVSATSTIGKCHIVRKEEKFYYKDADVLRFRCKLDLVPTYFIYCLRMPYVKEQIDASLGITTVGHFTIMNAKKILIPLPPLPLQNRFAGFARQADKSGFEIRQALKKLEIMRDSLMQKYFY
jgi:type I restriction enzyme S subunit